MYCTWESIDTEDRPRTTHFKSFLLPEINPINTHLQLGDIFTKMPSQVTFKFFGACFKGGDNLRSRGSVEYVLPTQLPMNNGTYPFSPTDLKNGSDFL